MNVWIVEEFCESIDSVWNTKADADLRKDALDKENGGEFASVSAYKLNEPNGLVIPC